MCLSQLFTGPHTTFPELGPAANQRPAGQITLLKGRKVLGKLQLECSFCFFLRSVSEVYCYPPLVFNWNVESIWEFLCHFSLKALILYSTSSVDKCETASQFLRTGTIFCQHLWGERQKNQACCRTWKSRNLQLIAGRLQQRSKLWLCWAAPPHPERSIKWSSHGSDSDTYNRYLGRVGRLLVGLLSVMKRCQSS